MNVDEQGLFTLLMKRRLLKLLSWLVIALLILWVVRTVSLREALFTIQRLQGWEIGALALANLLVLLALNGRWWLLLRGQGYAIPFLPLLGYRLAAFAVSYVTPGPHFGGEPLQVLLVERHQGVPRPMAIAAMTLDKLLELIVSLTLLAIGILAIVRWRLLPAANGEQAAVLFGTLACLPAGYLLATSSGRYPISTLVAKLAALPTNRARPAWQLRLQQAAATLRTAENQAGCFYHDAPGMLLLAILASLVGWLLMLVEYWLMVSFLGIRLTVPQLVTTITAAHVANLLLLPAGLGALETSQVVAFRLLGLDPAVGLSAGLLVRGRDMLLSAIGLAFAGFRLRSKSRGVTVKPME
jgi:uncharacterized protein (TIRG00374 family)